MTFPKLTAFTFFLITAALCAAVSLPASAAPSDYFRITVQDEQTGRGVPLVALTTVNQITYYTDSAGVAAVGDPELMGQKVFFQVKSDGYDYPADGFGYHGAALSVTAGGQAVLKIKRVNIAERLYRVTGGGIYRDSVLTGLPTPIKNPLLDGQVFGQDTVEVTPYAGKIFWFFGDTDRPAYPLGQFATSGATSLPLGKGGLDPSVGVDLTYWTDPDGFSKKMIPIADGPGPVWVGGLFPLRDLQGRERLLTRFVRVDSAMRAVQQGLAQFDDAAAQFKPIQAYPVSEPLVPEGHPFRATVRGQTYLYFEPTTGGAMPLVRVPADLAHITNPHRFQGFTCLAPGSRFDGENTALDRSADGRLRYAWKTNTPVLSDDQQKELIAAGKMKAAEAPFQLRDVETDAAVRSANGSTFWNPYRKRWIMITTQAFGGPSYLGEVWFAEADTPTGPWVYARRIVTHDHYTFYNPTQHPFFDQDGGRLVYFEGTYTDAFSSAPRKTPRYNYNQIMYRLSLDDPRLSLPVPVYAVRRGDGLAYETREQVDAAGEWASVQAVPFYAVPASRPHEGLVPVTAAAAFYALPVTPGASEKPSPSLVPLYEYKEAKHFWYSTDADAHFGTAALRSPQPICRVWRNPSSVLALDYDAEAVMPSP